MKHYIVFNRPLILQNFKQTTNLEKFSSSKQCCGAKTICFVSCSSSGAGSGLDYCFVTTCQHCFHSKSGFFMFFMKEYWLNSLAISYSLWFFIFIYRHYFCWPGARAKTLICRLRLQLQLQLQLRPKVSATCGSGSTTLAVSAA